MHTHTCINRLVSNPQQKLLDHFLLFLEQGPSFFLISTREVKVISNCPTWDHVSASVESVDPLSCQNPLPSPACAAHQATSFGA